MSGASEGLHEALDKLRPETIDRHRAIISLMEELEAVDWYDQRVDATKDEELRAILAHNRDEEKEHACMVLEWLRRKDTAFAHELETYLHTPGAILDAESGGAAGTEEDSAAASDDGSLGIGSLKGGTTA
ncbi:MAG: ferritin-like domain-containing protein [Gammaproteobacteria bacterium]